MLQDTWKNAIDTLSKNLAKDTEKARKFLRKVLGKKQKDIQKLRKTAS